MESAIAEVLARIEAEHRRTKQRPKELRVPRALRDAAITYLDGLDRRRGIVPSLPQARAVDVEVFGVRLIEEEGT